MNQANESIGHYMTSNPLTVEGGERLEAAQSLMRERGIRHLPVVDDGVLVGILSDRDVHFSRSLRTMDPTELLVRDAMTPSPLTLTPRMPLREVAMMMAQFRCGSVLIVDQGQLVGIFTTVDALRVLAELLAETEEDESATPVAAVG